MRSSLRRLNLLLPAVVGGLIVVAFWAWWAVVNQEPARWYMPGPLGHEPGATPPPPGPRAYLTRALGSIDTMDRGEWAKANALTPVLAFSHNLNSIVPADLYDRHPELFPVVDGKRHRPELPGYYWNPDLGSAALADRAAGMAAEYFRRKPDALTFALGTNDGLWFGESEDTLRWVSPPRYFRQRPDYSDLVFNFTNEVAMRLSAEFPHRHVGALAYYWSENTPSFPVHPNVLPFLTADRSQGWDPAFLAEETALQRVWAQAGPTRLGVYDYIYGGGFLVPRYHPTLLAAHLRRARAFGFTDYYAEVYPNWGLDGPQPWLVAQLLKDPERDAGRLLEEYFRRYFRAAGPAMRRFFDRCERAWMEQTGPSYWLKHWRDESQFLLFPAPVRADLDAALAAAKADAGGDQKAAARVAWVADAWRLSALLAEMHEVRVALATAVLRSEPDAVIAALVARFTEKRDAAVAHDAWLRKERPGALFPNFGLADFIRHDPRPLAAAALADRRGAPSPSGPERLRAPGWTGPRTTARRIAGLQYGLEKADGWKSRVEPWENQRETWTDTAQGPVLRLENHKLTDLWQWLPVKGGERLRVRMDARGRASSAVVHALAIHWTDASGRPAGDVVEFRLPPGDWPEWVTLAGDLTAPPAAAGISVTLWVGHQQPGDWAEFRGISLRGEGP